RRVGGPGLGVVAAPSVQLLGQRPVQVPAHPRRLGVGAGNRHRGAVVCRGAARDRDQQRGCEQAEGPVTEDVHRPRVDGGYRCTTGQVRVRVMPSTCWTLATTMRPRSSTVSAWARTMTSYG